MILIIVSVSDFIVIIFFLNCVFKLNLLLIILLIVFRIIKIIIK